MPMQTSPPNTTRSELQIPGARMWQNNKAQGVSSATEALYRYLLSNFENNKQRVLELGSGSGVLSIVLARHFKSWQITGLEIQFEMHKLAVQNASSLCLPINFVHGDLRTYQADTGFDVIVSNPPWQKLGGGLLSPLYERAVSRSEVLCTLADVLDSCRRNLAEAGEIILLYPISRREEVLIEAERVGLRAHCIQPADSSSLIFHLNPDDSEFSQSTMKRGGNFLIATCRSGDQHPYFHVNTRINL